jgi:hypothetical protein
MKATEKYVIYNSRWGRLPVFWKAFFAIIIVLFLNYLSELLLYTFILPRSDPPMPPNPPYPGFNKLLLGFSKFLLAHLFVATILILLFEIPRKRIRTKWWHLIILLLISYPASIAVRIVLYILRDGFSAPFEEGFSFMAGIGQLSVVLMSLLTYAAIVFWDNLLREHDNVLRTESLMSEAKWQMLRYQVNPHFLFNSLNSIMALINKDKDLARSMVNELANYFRHTLSIDDNTVATVRNEVKSVVHYLAIQLVRFDDRLTYEIDVSPETEELAIPVFGIQTLVENAVKYGLKTAAGEVLITIKIYRDSKFNVIRVINTGSIWNHDKDTADDKNGSTNSGLTNLKSRLSIMYPNMFDFTIEEINGEVHAIILIEVGAEPKI